MTTSTRDNPVVLRRNRSPLNPTGSTILIFLLITATPLFAQQTGETVRLQGNIKEDVYAAGGTVDALANIDGDLVAAGGRVSIREQISSDVIAVGGSVSIQADIGDDLRVAGGDLSLNGNVGGDAIMAGGNISIDPATRIYGRAWFAGGRVDIAGELGRELKAAGGEIIISGTINGDVQLTSESIRILDTAIINGNLTYRSPEQAEIASGARIQGVISYEPVEKHAPTAAIVAVVAGIGIITLLSLFITGGIIYLMFPGFMHTTITTIRADVWKSLGLGLAVFAATPVVIGILFAIVIGWLPALVIGTLYLLLLLAGFLTGVLFVGDYAFGLHKREDVSNTRRLVSYAVALIVVMLVGLIPLLGTLLLFILMLLGTGALKLVMYRLYTTS